MHNKSTLAKFIVSNYQALIKVEYVDLLTVTVYPDKTDGLPNAETAFFKPHQARGPNREDCPDALFVWRDWKVQDDKSIYKRGHPGYMYEGNRILLDPHNNPVVNHKFIPLTLSAWTHASKLQEMALHAGCKQGDCKYSLYN